MRFRRILLFSALCSVAIHGVLLWGYHPHKRKVAPPSSEKLLEIAFVLPDIKELEETEPEPQPTGEAESAEAPVMAPMLVDLPRPTQLGDFVQELDYTSFVDRSALARADIWVIPESRRSGKIREYIGNIFNLADLDRIPEPRLQPPPVFPASMRREASDGKVIVEFIVDTLGHVVNASAIETSHPGFNEAAIKGVERWTFRPGIRGGRKVNTRIRVPILFHLIETD
jgi:protein TonB